MKIKYIPTLVMIFIASIVLAQVPSPGAPSAKPTIISGATLHIGNGEVYKEASIGFMNGIIVPVDSILSSKNFEGYHIVDATGKHIYPGFIAPNSTIGLSEIDAVRSTRDFNEVGHNNANIRTIIAYNTDSRVTPTIRSNGVLITQIVPLGGLISGQSSIVQLDAWNWEDASILSDDGIHINWPIITSVNTRNQENKEEEKNHSDAEIQALEKIFSEAYAYSQSPSTPVNLKLESFNGVFSGKKKIYVHVDGVKEMISAVSFMKKYNITPIVVGGEESYLITSFLRENKIPIVLIRTHNLPALPEDDIDLPYKLPKLLLDSGVKFCIAEVGNWQQRNLPFQAGTAVAYGLTKEQALSAITKSTAEIVGISAKYGTLEPGKSATLIISEGDVLDTRTSIITHAWIDGRIVDLDNPQKQLDKKFRKKYFNK